MISGFFLLDTLQTAHLVQFLTLLSSGGTFLKVSPGDEVFKFETSNSMDIRMNSAGVALMNSCSCRLHVADRVFQELPWG